jgi:hypothetical protein
MGPLQVISINNGVSIFKSFYWIKIIVMHRFRKYLSKHIHSKIKIY